MGFNSIVYNEDCIKGMQRYEDKYFDLAIVDPPYGIGATNMNMGHAPNRKEKGQYSGESTAFKLKKKRLQRLGNGGGKLKNRILNKSVINWDTQPNEEYFKELFRVSKNQIIWGGNYFIDYLYSTRCIILWDKIQPWENFSQFEFAWTSFDKPAKVYKISNTGGANFEKKIHPTQKPVKLYKKTLFDFANTGIKILDTHLGSGSSRIAAYDFGCDFTGFEIDKIYFDEQNQRFNKHISQLNIFSEMQAI